MYLDYFGLKEEPFSLTPDPKFIYFSPQHEIASESILYGIREKKGFLLLTGEIGTGKTTLCRNILNNLDDNCAVSVILNPLVSTKGLLEAINRDFGNQVVEGGIDQQLVALNDFLLKRNQHGSNALVLIDEAQNLSVESLEMVRLLSNLETDTEKLLQILLVGQPELEKTLASYEMRQLNQRISVRQKLRNLAPPEVEHYLYHRLMVAGARGNIRFSRSALAHIFKYAKGFPRQLNNLCDRIMLAAYANNEQVISKRLVKDAIADLSGTPKYRTLWGILPCR